LIDHADRLEANARSIICDNQKFGELLSEFLRSPMAKKHCHADATVIQQKFDASDDRARFRLSQLLLYALQYQNRQESVTAWRDKLLVLSASMDDQRALYYALRDDDQNCPVERAYVIEYAPPAQGEWIERVNEIIREFNDLGLGEMYPDRDREAFIPFAMAPQYVLGYSELELQSVEAAIPTYGTNFHGNPNFKDPSVTLKTPPDLTDDQLDALTRLREQMPFVWRTWFGWTHISSRSGTIDISAPVP
jgi:hypothetical protein